MGLTPELLKHTIQSFPANGDGMPLGAWVMQLASYADAFPPWGRGYKTRDKMLREFWPSEPILAGAVATVAARNAAITVEFDGPPRTVKAVQEMWNNINFGKGAQHFLTQVSLDLYTQDNGAFVELIRAGNSEKTPVIGLAHLDSGACIRTGIPAFPVVYIDPRTSERHKLAWWQVVTLEEMPSPIETMNGLQYCALTRILRAAQLMRDLNIYEDELISGRDPNKIHLVGGIGQTMIEDRLRRHAEQADNQGKLRQINDVVIGSLDPTANVQHDEITLKSLPEGWDKAEAFRQYIAVLALGFLEDYQTFAPLPGGNLGTSTQSEVLHRKAQGKGKGIFAKLLIHTLMNYGIIPQSVEAAIEEKDTQAEQEEAAVAGTRAGTRAARIASGEITTQVARQIAEDEGDLDHEYLIVMGEQDLTEDVTVSDDQRAETDAEMQAGVSVGTQTPQAAPDAMGQLQAVLQGKQRRTLSDEIRATLAQVRKALRG